METYMIKRLCLSLALMANVAYAADTIVINAKVITVDKDRPAAEAFAIDNGRFTAVGSDAEILKLKTPSTKVIDLKGMTVTPGFDDAHVHPQAIFEDGSLYYRPWLGADHVQTIDQLIAVLKKKAAITPQGKLISGYGYDDVK